MTTTNTTTAPAPKICAGSATYSPCTHYNASTSDCDHPKNLELSLVTGKPVRRFFVSHLRDRENHCGPTATWYAPAEPF